MNMTANHKIITITKIKLTDKKYFLKWWRDKDLIALTSGKYEKATSVLEGYFSNMLHNKSGIFFIINLDNKPIGNVSLIFSKNKFEIQIIIEPLHWGKGYGSQAIQQALAIGFKRHGMKKVFLAVRANNHRAIRAYSKCGFKITREFLYHGVKMLRMEKFKPELF